LALLGFVVVAIVRQAGQLLVDGPRTGTGNPSA